MRLIAVAIVLAAVIIVVGLRSPEGTGPRASSGPVPEVVWEDDEPYCPHCRTDVNWYASVCYTCAHEFTWAPAQTECGHCATAGQAARFRRSLEHPDFVRRTIRQALEDHGLPEDVIAATIPDLLIWVESISEGACGLCGGTGRWLAPAMHQADADEEDRLASLAVEKLGDKCPACLGSGRCVACGGDRRVAHGDEAAHRGLYDLHVLLGEIDPLEDPDGAELQFRTVREFVTKHVGTFELEEVGALYSGNCSQLDWADFRRDMLDPLLEGD